MLETIISKNFKLIQKLGINPFYEVFKGIHIKNETKVAIKIEKRSVSQSKLFNEAKIIKQIQGDTTDLGIPQIIQMGTQDTFNYMIMNLLGPSLEIYMLNNGGKINYHKALILGIEMIQRLEQIHIKGYIHRDLRPDHLLYGRQKNPNKLFLTGLSIAKKYLRIDQKHTAYKDNKISFTGTAKFSSINTLLGIQQSRRDDLESIIYILIYLMKGYLPWQGIKAYDKAQKFQKILFAKITTPIQIICKDLPKQIAQILEIVRCLQYEQQPNYKQMKNKLNDASKKFAEDLIIQ